jgi:acyl-CoA synthetase (AMP-forming)/AMP-acid ligase II/1-acyl-sn-glycerol-3-phosphate acyltransferase/acyl carrier protein
MLRIAQWIVCTLSRWLMQLRYSVRTEGLEAALKRPGPYLILPSHPAYMDPPNVIVHLLGVFRMRPMLLETNFENPLLKPFAWLLGAINVPELERASAEARDRAQAAVMTVTEALRAGDNVVLWPTGTLSRDGKDYMGAARTASDVLRAVPGTTVVLIRTRGLWGSSFSWARTGQKPRLTKGLFRGALKLIANLIVFAPRRKVTMTLAAFSAEERPAPTRETLNPWIEAWYNADGGESPTYVPTHFLIGPRTYDFPEPAKLEALDISRVKPTIKDAIAVLVAEHLKRPLADTENSPDTTFAQLGLDSLESMEIALAVEQQFGFASETVPVNLGQLWALASGLLASGPPKPPPPKWFAAPTDTNPLEILGETVPEAFWNRAQRHPGDVAAADDLAGVLSFERLLIGALTMAERFRTLPGESVGLLLPASVAADIAFLGLHFVGKTPIALNWTTGPAAMAHAVRITGLTRVITSQRFIDRTRIDVPGAELVYLESVRETVRKVELIKRLVMVRFFPGILRRRIFAALASDPNRAAVVLFTSGSEKAPKAVPLTHANIIADMRGAVPPQKLTRADSVLGFLPMFHSFGLTIAGLFPLLSGAKVVHHPDPTDATGLAKKAVMYQATIIIGTPTFLSFLLSRTQAGELPKLRLIVVGAEKCPDDLFDLVAAIAPQATVLEGYGVTECSPCVAVNPVDAPRRGSIGKALPNVSVCVRDLESDALLPADTMGMLHVSGPTVFPGYLAHDGEQPFKMIDGVKWYITGDLATLDADGYIHFRGRLKRFLKAAGEMISLPALEEPLALAFPAGEDGPRVAVEGVERTDGKHVVLFTTFPYSTAEANKVLQANGFRGLMRIDEVQTLAVIPVLGTGKTDYKSLKARIAMEV